MIDSITLTTPLNIQEEKARFFADSTYNPQFAYQEVIDPAELAAWGHPQPQFAEHALKFLTNYARDFVPRDENDLVTHEDVEGAIDAFNTQHVIRPPVEVVFSKELVAKCKVTPRKIFFHEPLLYTHSQFADLCRHELETHLLRLLNHETQPWKDVSIQEVRIRRTEEGWANLHTFLYRTNKVLTKSYVTYTAVNFAQQMGFRDVFDQMRGLGISKDLSWRLALRTKRGLEDTSQPGGLTRDICYFEGTVKVWDWIVNQKNDPRECYLGRLALDDIPTYRSQADMTKITYPTFMENMEEYHQHIQTIGEINTFTNLV